MSKDRQAELVLEYQDVIKSTSKGKKRTLALTQLEEKYKCGPRYAERTYKRLKMSGKLPSPRTGVGRTPTISPAKLQEILETLHAHAYDLTFCQLAPLVGIPKST